MNEGELSVKLNEMREAATTIRTSAQRIDEIMMRVELQIQALNADRYAGNAAEQFRGEYVRLTPVLRDAHQKLLTFQEKLTLSADEIEAAARPVE
jgi:WXG100 family type VII secretion target